ncbi:hypothetical protein [Streptomyces sp. CMSTAAHL-2]|uniref:hypothetical protein n=1 Tax=Streptomyces sp. CMSTAAHL-2 TaxID=2904522 RepID=UPI001E4913A4|nr:hypothetical protein [Streptomyces sp. CMSTAAHL-2]MCE3036196.1 hypothetical protein [Streptomyces sp. CMSTAAHL-2]
MGEREYWAISGANFAFAVLPGHEDGPRLHRDSDWKRDEGGARPGRDGVLEAARQRDEWARFAADHPPALPAPTASTGHTSTRSATPRSAPGPNTTLSQ